VIIFHNCSVDTAVSYVISFVINPSQKDNNINTAVAANEKLFILIKKKYWS
jgi:hypothetical protein